MGKIVKPDPVKLIIGFIFQKESIFDKIRPILEKRFAKIDFESQTLPFEHTDYYEKEFGRGLKRKFVSFQNLILPEELPKIKVITNRIEKRLSRKSSRLINIDPGYLDLSKLVLASTKNYSHRIYLNRGIYAEVTLVFKNKSFRAWEWTYPDYRTSEYIFVFNQIRQVYAGQIKDN